MVLRPQVVIRQCANIGQRAAAARIDAPADDPPTQPAELDGQRAVELARRVDILEPELLQKHRRVDPDQIERQAARLVGVEVERRRMQDQLAARSEEHTSELQSLMRIAYSVFCLKKKKHK